MLFIPYGTDEASPRRAFPYINVFIVVANLIAFFVEYSVLATQGEAAFERLVAHYSFIPNSLEGNFLQVGLLTSLFLHAGIVHIIGNMLYLLPFGDNVEDRLGPIRYLLFYLICGVAANLIFALFNRHSNVPLIGASGAIAGVLGGYLALHPTHSSVKGIVWIVIFFFRLRLPAILFIGYWFIMQLFNTVATLGAANTVASGGVAFLAHVGGFVVGLVLAPILAKRNSQPATR
ncbi:MAG: rhomboid family protein [Candidatus Saccharibacteria bacterium]|nr:rhomboid family protein [Candidatus Saccharibacteria bacterium]